MINQVVLTGMKQQCMWSPHIQSKVTSDRLYAINKGFVLKSVNTCRTKPMTRQ